MTPTPRVTRHPPGVLPVDCPHKALVGRTVTAPSHHTRGSKDADAGPVTGVVTEVHPPDDVKPRGPYLAIEVPGRGRHYRYPGEVTA